MCIRDSACVYNPHYEPDVYNVRMKVAFESAVDYITMHYTYSQRKGKFWDYVRQNIKKPGMQEFMEGQINDPLEVTFQNDRTSSFFGGSNWHVWLLQLMPEVVPKQYWHSLSSDIVPRFENYLNTLHNNVNEATPQKIFLKEWYGQKNYMV